jgi:hypothetical protein
VPGSGREPELNERQPDARRRVHQSLEALGGLSSPAGSCVWHVVGLQRSVREWAIRRGWGGRPVRQEQAQGILVTAWDPGRAFRIWSSQARFAKDACAVLGGDFQLEEQKSASRRAAGRDPKPIFPNSSDLLALQIEAEIGTQEICWPARSCRLF